jgi:hypothetical protein
MNAETGAPDGFPRSGAADGHNRQGVTTRRRATREAFARDPRSS